MIKAGILGGGQLGRMLLQSAANFPIETYVMENDEHCPSAHLCHHFVKGDIQSYGDVYNFGKSLDVLTIEIEAVNIEALEQLEKEGLTIIPKPSAIKTIQDKILQKQFYKENQIPSPHFVVTQDRSQVAPNSPLFPAVHKIGKGGYDGKGVAIINNEKDIHKAFDAPSVLEKKIDIVKEIAVIVARSQEGESVAYPATEMVVNPILNLLDYQLSPAQIPIEKAEEAKQIALQVVSAFDSPGVFAVEMFLDTEHKLWVNETAPRVHNSGHHTIEANLCSQFEMLWRILLNLPLGDTQSIRPSALINLIGGEGHFGKVAYQGLSKALSQSGAFLHLYGKSTTKPGRKMGHITLLSPLSNDYGLLIEMVKKLRNSVLVVSNEL